MGRILLGIDCGGTHTDCVLVEEKDTRFVIRAQAKVTTDHADLPGSVSRVLEALAAHDGVRALFPAVSSVTLGTTLAVNAIVQGKTEKVGLLLSAGPGLSPWRFALGEHSAVVSGGLDHRGVEVQRLDLSSLPAIADAWKKAGIQETGCVGKFSPRNPRHEEQMASALEKEGFHPCLGHRLSGALHFPRRIATVYYNMAVRKVHAAFLDAVEKALERFSIKASVRLLKADGGAVPLGVSRTLPVASILSGPAASVMGILALTEEAYAGASLLLDVGGTTTDISVILDGSPVLDRFGMLLEGRRTLVRALASQSIGVGGDSRISFDAATKTVQTGPLRDGAAMAFGGERATFLDALNYAHYALPKESGDTERSRNGIESLAAEFGLSPDTLAQSAIDSALTTITNAAFALLKRINMHPIYTLRALREHTVLKPERVILVGGPAACLDKRLAERFNLPVIIPAHADVANAVGACLTRPTARLEVYGDTGKRCLRAPMLEHEEKLSSSATLDDVALRSKTLLEEYLASNGFEGAEVEVVEADLFATLDDYGASSRDLRVTAQVVPGIAGKVDANCAL